MELNYFYSLTPSQFQNVSQGKQSHMEWQAQTSWEQARWLAMVTLQPHLKKGRTIKPKDLAVFPWEESVERVKKRKEDTMAAFMAMVKKSNNKE